MFFRSIGSLNRKLGAYLLLLNITGRHYNLVCLKVTYIYYHNHPFL